ncbi:MAG: sulfite exporter TauE/SafE family protein, partial [Candidatus Woesearchaeota archaeon]|nr:sulfite exporter TauE/SafE family protein [Candidatus Woesearchaeota archaeon]
VLSAVFSYTIINSAALSTFSNTVTNLISLIIFSLLGAVQFVLFIPIILSSFIGAYLGSKYAVKIGNVNVKRLLLVIAIIMAIKLLFF